MIHNEGRKEVIYCMFRLEEKEIERRHQLITDYVEGVLDQTRQGIDDPDSGPCWRDLHGLYRACM